MISIKTDDGVFDFRIAGILIKSNQLLVHRAMNDDFYAIPGGHVELHEESENTLIREYQEEIGANIKIDRLLWVQENFFEYNGNKCHSICFYYLIDLIDTTQIPLEGVFYTKENNDTDLEFHWHDINKLSEITLYPSFLKDKIHNLPMTIERVVDYD